MTDTSTALATHVIRVAASLSRGRAAIHTAMAHLEEAAPSLVELEMRRCRLPIEMANRLRAELTTADDLEAAFEGLKAALGALSKTPLPRDL